MACVSLIQRVVRHSLTAIAICTGVGCAQYSGLQTKASIDGGAARWQGRIAVLVESSPKQAFSANFDLQGNSQNGQMELSTTLGTTLAQLRWSAQEAQLEAGGTTRTYPSLRELTLAAMGAELPLAALLQWLRGIPASSEGWQSDLREFDSGRLAAQRLTPEPRVDLKIILDR